MICYELWGNSVTLYNKKNSTMKIWQCNNNNENLIMKIQQWKWQQSKFDNDNSTMKIWQWKCNNENANNEIKLAKILNFKGQEVNLQIS